MIGFGVDDIVSYYSKQNPCILFILIFPKDNASHEDMMDGIIDHIKSFFAENSTLMTSLDAARTNMTNIFTAALQNYSLMEALNKSMQEAIL